MEIATNSTTGINMVPTDTVPLVTVSNIPYLTAETPVQCNTHQLVNLYQDGSIINSNPQPSYILTTNPDGTSTILLDSAQLALLTGQAYPIYDGTKVFQFATQDVTEPSTVTIITEANDNEFQDPVLVEEANLAGHLPSPVLPPPPPNIINQQLPPLDDDIQPPLKKGQFKCLTCYLEFDKPEKLNRHQRKHADEKPFPCSQCGASFNIESNLTLHEATHCVDNPTCPHCQKKFSRMASLKSHIHVHELEESLMCANCGDEFNTQFKFNNHKCLAKVVGCEVEVEEPTFSCKKCSRKFIKLLHLKEHMKVHRKLKISLSRKRYRLYIDRSSFPHKCFTCGKQFKKPSQLVRHVRIHTGEKPFKCETCNKAFNQKGALHIHMTKHNGFRPHLCNFCPATFSQRGNLRAHIKRVHVVEDEDKIHQCPECSCVFKKLGSLHTHLRRTHSNTFINNYNGSDYCDASVNKHVDTVIGQLLDIATQTDDPNQTEQRIQKIAETNKVSADILQQALENSGLVSNDQEKSNQDKRNLLSKSLIMSITDTVTGKVNKHFVRKVGSIRYYQCIYCSREFKKPSDLIRHIRIHTHERPYKCHLCFRAFSVKSTLTAHIRTHSGEKPFRCNVCHKAFSSQGSLRVHILLHTGAKPYACGFCNKAFRTSGHRRSHMLSHQKNNTTSKNKQRGLNQSENNVSVPDLPLPEPIFISNEGYIQPFVEPEPSQGEGEPAADRPHQCHVCMKGFKKSSHLKQHIHSHTGEKPYECNTCHRNFVSNGVLKAHVKTHLGIKAHKCDTCESSFTTRGSLKRHLLIHTDERPFMCPYCQKTFKMQTTCRKHMRSHRHELAQGNAGGVTVTIISDSKNDDEDNNQENELTELGVSTATSKHILTEDVEASDAMYRRESVLQQNGSSSTLHSISSRSPPKQQVVFRIGEIEQTVTGTYPPSTMESQPSILSSTVDEPDVVSSVFYTNASSIDNQLISSSLPVIPEVKDLPCLEGETNDSDHPSSKQRTKKTYSCMQCPRTFRKSSHLEEHIRSHTGEKPYRCAICDHMFVSASVLRNHVKIHSKVKEFCCTVCEARFSSKASLTRHTSIHSADKSIHCSYCSEIFAQKELYQEHVALYHQDVSTADIEAIEILGEEKPDLLRTLLEKRARPPPIQMTEEETEILAKQNPEEAETVSLKVLIAAAAEKNTVKEIKDANKDYGGPKFLHACKHCPKSFKKPSDLVRHLRIHTGEKPFTCEHCNKSFTVKSTLDSHMKTHSGEKNFDCHVCLSQFATKGSLKVHMRLHTGSKPFKCPYCELNFRTSGHRKSHISSHFKSNSNKRQKLMFEEPSVEDTVIQLQTVGNSTDLNAVSSHQQFQQEGEGIRLQLAPNVVGQSIQITGVDPNMLSKEIHIDPGLMQQLQQPLNINITINPSMLQSQTTETTVEQISSHQLAELANPTTITVNPNVIIQQLGFAIAKPQNESLLSSNNTTNYSIICPATGSAEDVTIMNNYVGHTISAADDIVYLNENIDGNSIIIEQRSVDPGEQDKLTTYNITDILQNKQIQVINSMGESKDFRCTLCNISFSRKSQLTSHNLLHQKMSTDIISLKKNSAKKFQCNYCEQTFVQKRSLVAHLKQIHEFS